MALNIIGRYLKETRDKVFVLNPSPEPKMNWYLDANFSGLFGHNKATYSSCVKIRTGYAIVVADCPVLGKYKLKTKTNILTMEADII